MRFIKNYYKKIGVAVLIALLAISTVINFRIMSRDEAKAVASQGNYERYEELRKNNGDSENHGNKSNDEVPKKGKTDSSVEPKGNRLQNLSFFEKKNSGGSNKGSDAEKRIVSTTEKNNKSSEGKNENNSKQSNSVSAFKPMESSETGEREKLKNFIGEAWNHTGQRYKYILYQEPDYSKEISVTVQVDYLSIFEDGVECNDERFAERLQTDGYILHPTKIICYQGENCWDAIARALIENDIQYTCDAEPFKHGYAMNNNYGTCYLTCCDNMYTGVNTENKPGPFGTTMSGWTYTVTNKNGKTVYPGLGMNGVLVKDGDTLCLKYHNGLSMFSMDEYGDF